MRIVYALILALLSAAGADAGVLTVSVEPVPSSTIAGIPVALRFIVDHKVAAPVMIPQRLALIATNSRGESFLVRWSGTPALVDIREFTPAGRGVESRRAFEVSPDGVLLPAGLFGDARLNQPGTYSLEAFLMPNDFDREELGDGDIDVVRDQATASSPRVTLSVAIPHDDDAEVWFRLQQLASGQWSPQKFLNPAVKEFAREVIRSRPDSAYAGWFAATGAADTPEQDAEILRKWLESAPIDGLTEARKYRLTIWDVFLAEKWATEDPGEARRHAKAAHDALPALMASKSERMRTLAQKQSERLGQIPGAD